MASQIQAMFMSASDVSCPKRRSVGGALRDTRCGPRDIERAEDDALVRRVRLVVEGVAREAFLILPHPEVAKFIQFKSADYDRWLGAMRTLRGRIVDEIGSTRLEEMHKLV